MMDKKKATVKKATVKKAEKVEFSNSIKEVQFTSSTDLKGFKKGEVYVVSENVASILKFKGLGDFK